MKTTQSLLVFVAAFVVIIAIIVAVLARNAQQLNDIDSYQECAAAGYPIMESYPERCSTPDGRTFTNSIGQEVSYTGTIVCLPHKDTSGPVTLECAYGLQTSDGKYHGLRSDDPDVIFSVDTGKQAIVVGTVIATDSIYDTVDTIEIMTIEEINL